jgi:hypothetical protein
MHALLGALVRLDACLSFYSLRCTYTPHALGCACAPRALYLLPRSLACLLARSCLLACLRACLLFVLCACLLDRLYDGVHARLAACLSDCLLLRCACAPRALRCGLVPLGALARLVPYGYGALGRLVPYGWELVCYLSSYGFVFAARAAASVFVCIRSAGRAPCPSRWETASK